MAYDCLKLSHQLCFPLYAASKEVVRRYRPFLDELNLTYTQYIAMMVLWEEGEKDVKELGERLFLDSGTLTPLLNQLRKKNYIQKRVSKADHRYVKIVLTQEGKELEERAKEVPNKIASCVNLDPDEAGLLYRLLYKILGSSN